MNRTMSRTVWTAAVLLALGLPAHAQLSKSSNKGDAQQSQQQPQGETGPLNTASGGAPAASPQGETPAGMQHQGTTSQGTGNSAPDKIKDRK